MLIVLQIFKDISLETLLVFYVLAFLGWCDLNRENKILLGVNIIYISYYYWTFLTGIKTHCFRHMHLITGIWCVLFSVPICSLLQIRSSAQLQIFVHMKCLTGPLPNCVHFTCFSSDMDLKLPTTAWEQQKLKGGEGMFPIKVFLPCIV